MLTVLNLVNAAIIWSRIAAAVFPQDNISISVEAII